MVDSVAAAMEAVVANGGEIVQPIGARRSGDYGAVSRSAGNVLGFIKILFREEEA